MEITMTALETEVICLNCATYFRGGGCIVYLAVKQKYIVHIRKML